jgi:hypothetical protein
MILYTRAELAELCMALRECRYVIGIFLKKKAGTDKWTLKEPEELYATMISPKCSRGRQFTQNPLGKYRTLWSGRFGEVRELMFDTPLDDMPLFINDTLLSIIAKWRLKIAR